MDALKAEEPAVSEDEALDPRATLKEIAGLCEQVLTNRIAKRFSTRDSLKNLKARAEALLEREGSWQWDQDFEKFVTTANAVFDEVIAQSGAAA